MSQCLWASVSDLNPKLGVTMGGLGGRSIEGSGDGSIGHGSGGRSIRAAAGACGTFGAAAGAVGDARVGVLLSFLFLEAERGGVQALGVAPAVRLRLLFHQRCNMVINEFINELLL